jgi:hypothetical protein
MDDGRFKNKDNGGFGNEDGGFGKEDNGIENEEDNECNVLNAYLLEQMRLYDVGGEDDDQVSVVAGPGGGGGRADEAVANEAVDVAVADVMDDEAVGPPLMFGELVDATIVFPADDDAHVDVDVPNALSIPRCLFSGSDLINAPVAEITHRQYNRDNADFMMYLWYDRPELLSISEMELSNRASASVHSSCFKSSEEYDKADVQNMKKAGLIIVSNPAHDPVDFDNLNVEVFAEYMVYLAEHRTNVMRTSFDGKRSALYYMYCFYCREYSRTMEIQLRHAMSGMRSRIARHQQERGMRVTSGRDPMPFELYQKLCELAMKKGGRDGNFLYTYMVMTWNLVCWR